MSKCPSEAQKAAFEKDVAELEKVIGEVEPLRRPDISEAEVERVREAVGEHLKIGQHFISATLSDTGKASVEIVTEEEAIRGRISSALPMGGCDEMTCTRSVPHHGGYDTIIFARHPDGSFQIVGSFHEHDSRGGGHSDHGTVSRERFNNHREAVLQAWQVAANRLFGARAPQIDCLL